LKKILFFSFFNVGSIRQLLQIGREFIFALISLSRFNSGGWVLVESENPERAYYLCVSFYCFYSLNGI